jgi:pimeloyl-ACP methyl ester carboxylesterase
MALAAAGICLLLAGVFLIRQSALPQRDTVIAAGNCHTPATILDPPAGTTAVGAAVVLHGLGANRRTMTYLGEDFAGHGFRTYLFDLPGHGDNQEAFTFARAEECADATLEFLTRAGQIDAGNTILIGHSMGGAIATRMADRKPVAATIAISPAPMVLPRRMPSNLLVFVGGYDLWPMKREAKDMAAAAGGERTRPVDFAERRAFRVQMVPHATHTSLIVNRTVARRAELWATEAVFPSAGANTEKLTANLATDETFDRGGRSLEGSILGLLGLIFLFPATTLIVESIAIPSHAESMPSHPQHLLVVVEQAVCALVAVLILALDVPLRFIHLYDGDYLASLLLLAGALLLALNWRYVGANFELSAKALLAASTLGFAAFLATGAWFSWQLGDLWMSAPRWLRFAALLPVGYIFSFAGEVALGPVGEGRQRWWRFVTFLVMRLELWLACIFAYYELTSGRALLGVLVIGMAVFSALQRLATDALRLRTGSATAAAAFGAILAAWFIAAVFPLA